MPEIIVYLVCVMALTTGPPSPDGWTMIEMEPHEHYQMAYMKQPIKEYDLVAVPTECGRAWMTVTVKGAP